VIHLQQIIKNARIVRKERNLYVHCVVYAEAATDRKYPWLDYSTIKIVADN
jgi:hypothetical protein